MSVSFDDGPTLAARMRRHAKDHDHLYGHLMRQMADDWEQGGPVRDIFAGYEHAPAGSVLQLRLLAGLFRIVLTGRAPELEPYYPCLGGTASPSDAWPIARAVLAAHVPELRDALEIAPQTNEVGRANALLAGLLTAVARTGRARVRLLEPGASAGLNLLIDRLRFVNHSWDFGPLDSPVVLQDGIVGRLSPRAFTVVQRRGCDLSPVDITTDSGRLRLRSFVWPFQVHRHQRLDAALTLAAADPPVVDEASAGEWLEEQLLQPVDEDVLTCVWQSVTRLYWPPEETERVNAAVAAAAREQAIAHVSMEYELSQTEGAVLTLDWSDGKGSGLRQERLATVGDHGFPVTLLD